MRGLHFKLEYPYFRVIEVYEKQLPPVGAVFFGSREELYGDPIVVHEGEMTLSGPVYRSTTRRKTRLVFQYTVAVPEMTEIRTLLYEFFGNSDKVIKWLDVPNPMFGGISPSTLIQAGRAHKVLEFIKNAKF